MIVINAKYAIKSDPNQWILCKPATVTEKSPSGWEGFKYYTTLPALCDALRDIMLRTSNYKSFTDLTVNLAEINKLLDKKLKVSI